MGLKVYLMIKYKEFLFVLIACLALTMFSFFIHVSNFTNTMINYADEHHQKNDTHLVTDGFLPWAVDYHKTLPEFKKRPFTTFLIEKSASVLNLRISVAFVWVNFTFIFCCGFLIYLLAKLFQLSNTESVWSVVLFYCSFSILLAYFIPIATYDESIQYLFILISLIALKRKFKIIFILFLTLAIIARENTLILLPGIFLFLANIEFRRVMNEKSKFILVVLELGIPLFLYVLYLIWFFEKNPQMVDASQKVLSTKFMHYKKNFRDIENISRTLLSFFSVFLLPIFILVYYRIKHSFNECERSWLNAFWLTFLINTIIVLLSVYAEESRVFTLPLLFIFPFLGKFFTKLIRFSPEFFNYLFCSKRIVLLFISTSLTWFIFKFIYQFTNLNMNDNLYREYNTISIFLISLVLLYNRFSDTQKPHQ